MQMVQLRNIKRQSPAGRSRAVENVDLDEKIRRIREANRERERRFEEIEQDKKLALDPALMKKEYEQDRTKESLRSNIHTDVKSNELKTMKGVQPTATKTAKGRGQKLRELSNHPLKAERFKSRTKDQNESLEEYLPEKVTLKNNCRSSIRERIKTKNKDCIATVPMVKNENTQESDVSKVDDKLNCTPQGQQNEIPEDEILLHENKNSSQTTQESNDTQQSDDIKEETKTESHREGNVSPCKKNQQNSTETDQFLDNTEQETSASNRQLAKEPTTQKNKPKIRVSLKKTASSSSFDESMAMLSPLDLPQNWGDLDFSDDELPPPVSIW